MAVASGGENSGSHDLLQEVVRAVKRHIAALETQRATPYQSPPPASTRPVPNPKDVSSGLGASMPLVQFRSTIDELTLPERGEVVDAALIMIEQVYVHLPLKRAMHACDPVQRLKLLKYHLAEKSERTFHDEMISIFHSLRDLHTNYVLPASYQGETAYLPFLVEECFEGNPARRSYVVTKAHEIPADREFRPGVVVTHWNGIPIERAVELNAEREAGSNPDAQHARGLEALTLRAMAYSAPPDEDWVVISYKTKNDSQTREIRLSWEVFAPPPSPTGIDLATASAEIASVFGVDARTEALRRARKALFHPKSMDCERDMASAAVDGGLDLASAAPWQGSPSGQLHSPSVSTDGLDTKSESLRRCKKPLFFDDAMAMEHRIAQALNAAASSGTIATPSDASLMPDAFAFKKVGPQGEADPEGKIGYIRIYTFNVADANAFVSEFIRITRLLPVEGLIIDVRGNGGGNILAGERLLQVLTPEEIHPEQFYFINTPLTLELCQRADLGLDLGRWSGSIAAAIETGEVYSRGFPLDPPEEYNGIGQQYQGPVVLVVDALCYSTTDIFAAGFQDHNIGKILGVQARTGAGGANVWEYGLLQQVLPDRFAPLPKGVRLRVAVRRTTRVKDHQGVSLEDLGVKSDDTYAMSEDDLMNGNRGLISAAAALLPQTVYSLEGAIDRSRPPVTRLTITAKNVSRVDIYTGGRPIATVDLQNGTAVSELAGWIPAAGPLQLHGFDRAQLVVVRRVDL